MQKCLVVELEVGKLWKPNKIFVNLKSYCSKEKKIISSSKRLDSKKIIQKTTDNLNSIATSKEKKFISKKRLKASDHPLIYYYWIAPER